MKTVIVDYDAGNVKSLQFALERLGVVAQITHDSELISSADKVIFPGQGEAASAMEKLRSKGLDTLIPQLQQPVLGICLGMQLLCKQTEEGERRTPHPARRSAALYPVGHFAAYYSLGYFHKSLKRIKI